LEGIIGMGRRQETTKRFIPQTKTGNRKIHSLERELNNWPGDRRYMREMRMTELRRGEGGGGKEIH
jgi:hypothetical protein